MEDLQTVLFGDGISTKESVSEYSGRGVGMAAVPRAARDLGGTLRVHSEPGHGTRVELRFPCTVLMEPCRSGVERTTSGQSMPSRRSEARRPRDPTGSLPCVGSRPDGLRAQYVSTDPGAS